MTDDKTPQRPEGVDGDVSASGAAAPRVEVEPTPAPRADATASGAAGAAPQAGAAPFQPGSAQPTARIPSGAPSGSATGPGAGPGAGAAEQASGAAASQPAGTSPYAGGPGSTQAGGPQGAPRPVDQPPVFQESRTVVKTKTKKLPVFLASLAGFAVGAVLLIALVMAGVFRIGDGDVTTSAGSSQTIQIDPEDSTLAEAVSAKALPSVVSISATGSSSSAPSVLSGDSSDGESSGSIGSGVILDTDGDILTNYHVIEGYSQIAILLDSGESVEGEVVGYDESSDLAVVKIKDTKGLSLTPIEIGDSDSLTVGEWVMAIGSPFGNEQSVSTGIVSALYRSTALRSTSGTSIYANMIQTDAAINPGNSGGALVNDEGKLIGINSVIESYSGSSSGVGFAIPVNYAKKIADQIIAGKTPVHPYLGVTLTSVNALSGNESASTGARVTEVTSGGPADEAGIQAGDVITGVDGEQIDSADGLIIALREHEVGDKVKLTLTRDGKEQEVEVKLGSDEALQSAQQDSTEGNSNGSGLTQDELLQYLEELLGQGQGGQGYGQQQAPSQGY